jgi:putative transposase
MDNPGHRALRRGRVSLPRHVYHVTFATQGRRPLFFSLAAARQVARALNDPAVMQGARSLAWCLMPDHLHWLLQLGDHDTLSRRVQALKSVTSRALRRTGVQGDVWSRWFYDHAMRREEDLRAMARYIIANPLRAGLVETVGDYPHWDAIWL